MTQHELLGPVMVDIEGHTLTALEVERIRSSLVGGLILFTRNFSDIDQLKELIAQIRSVRSSLIIAVDHEGGRVQRFRGGFTSLPAMSKLGSLYEKAPSEGLSAATELGWLMAAELRSLDIDISFAPVMDREYGISKVIGDRAFSDKVDVIVALSAAFCAGMHEAGMANTGKHFPGHGAVEADSHIDIPVDPRSRELIEAKDMVVFSEMSKQDMDAVMPAHVIYPSVCEQPAGFSKVWIQEILREQCEFDGVVFSDDLSMEGATVAGSFSARADAALNAGCDMVLVCNNPKAADQVLQHLKGFEISRESGERLLRMLGKPFQLNLNQLQESERWCNAHRIARELASD